MRTALQMAQKRLLSVLALTLFIVVCPVLEELVSVNVGDSVNLTATKICTRDFKLTSHDSKVIVSKFVHGVWVADKGYKNRIEHLSPSAVRLTHVNYNDHDQLFEFFCAGWMVKNIKLEVVIPSDVSVTEGGNVTLPCHFFTADVKSVRWERSGELVFEQELSSSGQITYGTGFDGRASVSPDWYLTGDLSLTLKRVQPEDRGQFICYAVKKDGTSTRGNPAAVRLTVLKRNPDQVSCPLLHSTLKATEEKMGAGTVVAITVPVMIVIPLLLSLCGYWWLRSRRSNVSSGPGGGEPATHGERIGLTERTPPEVNGGPSRFNLNGY